MKHWDIFIFTTKINWFTVSNNMFCSIDIFLLCNLLKSIVCLFNVIKIKLVTFSKTGLKKIFYISPL